MPVLGNEEHKQRLNLSSLAHSVVAMDRDIMDEGGTLSGFLNRIICQFWDKADASIDVAMEERQNNLRQAGFDETMIEKLLCAYRDTLMQKKEAYPQGQSVTFRLNNRNFERLYTDRAEQDHYTTPGKYLKALIEEYARLSPSERERIYYRELIENTLQPAVDAGYLLALQPHERTFWVKPYCIIADEFNSHLYLVGKSRPEGAPAAEAAIASFRISRLGKVRRRSQPSGKLSVEECRDIEQKLQNTGVQYLIGEAEEIKLTLTPAGRREFLQRSYMRPVPEKIEDGIYYFHCTQRQIQNYFLSFGANVHIIQPESLKERFVYIYKKALDSYQ